MTLPGELRDDHPIAIALRREERIDAALDRIEQTQAPEDLDALLEAFGGLLDDLRALPPATSERRLTRASAALRHAWIGMRKHGSPRDVTARQRARIVAAIESVAAFIAAGGELDLATGTLGVIAAVACDHPELTARIRASAMLVREALEIRIASAGTRSRPRGKRRAFDAVIADLCQMVFGMKFDRGSLRTSRNRERKRVAR